MTSVRSGSMPGITGAILAIAFTLLAAPAWADPVRGDPAAAPGASASADKAVVDAQGRIHLKSSGKTTKRKKKSGDDEEEDGELVIGRPFEQYRLLDRIRFNHPLECRI